MKLTKQHILSTICMLILLIPNIACMLLATDLTYSWMKEITYLMVVLLLLLLPMTFLKRRTYFIVEGLIGLFWMPIEVSSLFLNGMTTSSHFIRIIVETNRVEATELLLAIWPLVILVCTIWAIYIGMVCKLKNEWILPRKLQHLVWLILPIFGLGGMGISYMLLPQMGDSISTREMGQEIWDKASMKFYKIYPYDIYLNAGNYLHQKHEQEILVKQLEHFRFGLQRKTDDQEEHYIFIIGEAARYDHFGINGYPRATSDELDTIRGLYSLGAVYSEANLTHNSVPILITRADLDNLQLGTAEKSLPEAFQEAGFKTAWLSTQPPMENVVHILNKMDNSYAAISGLDGGISNYDDILVEKYAQFSDTHPAIKTFTLMHMLGSHLKYDQRYPKEYEHFTPAVQAADGYAVLSAKNKEKVINAYDNTILYTSHVIAEAIQLLQKQNGIRALVYISDHGENLFDDERELSVHGSYDGTIHEAHVPCFVWLSDEFKAAYPEKVEALEANQKKQVQTDVIFYSLADIGGLDEIVDTKKSIFSPELQQVDTIRMMTGNGNIAQLTIE